MAHEWHEIRPIEGHDGMGLPFWGRSNPQPLFRLLQDIVQILALHVFLLTHGCDGSLSRPVCSPSLHGPFQAKGVSHPPDVDSHVGAHCYERVRCHCSGIADIRALLLFNLQNAT